MSNMYFATYDSTENTVQLEEALDGADFQMLVFEEPRQISVNNKEGDCVVFNQSRTKLTVKQAVILFSTTLAMREIAAD